MKSIMEEASSIAKAIETAWTRAGQPTEFSVKVLELPQTSFFGLKTSKSAKVAFFFNEATVTVRSKESSPADRHQRNNQQRPVTLRQPGTKPDHDQQRRPHTGQRPENREASADRNDTRQSSDYAKGGVYPERAPRAEGTDRREPREQRETREPREQREPSDYAKASTDRRDNRGFEQRQDRPNRPQGPRRPDDRNDRNRRPEYGKNPSDRQDDRRPRYESERADQGSYTQDSWTPDMAQIAQEWIKETLVLMGKPDITVNTQVSHNYLKVNLSAPVLEDSRQEETQLKSWGMLAMEAVREKAGKPLRSLRIILESNK